MKAEFLSARNLVLGAVAILLIPFSGCADMQPVQTAQIGNALDAGIPSQPAEKVRLEGLRFKAVGAGLRADSKPVLDAAAQILRSEPDNLVYVDVYCDRRDSKHANLQLAQQRAEYIKSYLEGQGVPSGQMIARGFGVENSADHGGSSQTHKRNSRIELISLVNRPVPTNLTYSLLSPRDLN
jgi:outer membrane protein OmpA-like peptidoglycan-associated protein